MAINQIDTGLTDFFDVITDSLLLFLVIPLSIPTFMGLHLAVLKRYRQAVISLSISLLIGLAYLIWIGPFPTFVIYSLIAVFYILMIGPFWLLEKIINWYEKKYIYDKYMKKGRNNNMGEKS